jgi:transcriptional regulator with XRE-family HTH domain
MTRTDTGVLESVAANLVRARRRFGFTQAKLAELADLDLRQVQRAESGRIDVGIVTLVVLARALDIAPGQLLRAARLVRAARGRPKAKKKKRAAR